MSTGGAAAAIEQAGPVNPPTTSMTTSVQPLPLAMSTLPVGPTWTIVGLGTVPPCGQFTSDAGGCATVSGHAGNTPAVVVLVTVRFATAAGGGLEPVIAGTPPNPATPTTRPELGPHGNVKPPVPFLLSRMRAGVSGVNQLPVPPGVVSVNQPFTSATTFVVPAGLKMLTLPPVPTPTITRFGMVSP